MTPVIEAKMRIGLSWFLYRWAEDGRNIAFAAGNHGDDIIGEHPASLSI